MFADVQQKIAAKVETFHKENPLVPGIAREDLRSSLGAASARKLFVAALDELVAQKRLEPQGELVKRRRIHRQPLIPKKLKAKSRSRQRLRPRDSAVPAVKRSSWAHCR